MKIDRLMGILTILLQNDSVTAPYLAERFEVARRTISRDIDALCRAEIPVITRQGKGGGISIAEGFKLDKSILTDDELAGMIAAIKGMGSISSGTSMERTLDKLSAHSDTVLSLREPIIIDLASHYKGSLTEKIEWIKKAILEYRLIEFSYFYEKGEIHRRIEPYFVVFQWSSWYVFGYCTLRKDFRMFKLMRLWDLKILDTSYTPREIPPEKREFHAGFPDQNTLTALFSPSARYQLIETYGLHCYTEMEDGRLRLEIGYTNEDFIISWLLGFGEKVQVLEPSSVADAIRNTSKKILERYT